MEIKKIKYFKVTCSKCNEEYTIDIELNEQKLICYKCLHPLELPELEQERIETVNEALKELSVYYIIEFDESGLVIILETNERRHK